MTRILLAVNDSPAGLAAARAAIRLAHDTAGPILAVHVAAEPDEARTASHPVEGAASEHQARALLGYIVQLAHDSGVPIETHLTHGPPAPAILEQAAGWGPDMIVLGRSGIRHVGQPFVGSQVLHMIEFSDVPVLVVPAV